MWWYQWQDPCSRSAFWLARKSLRPLDGGNVLVHLNHHTP
jgi:hypothetical protein